MSDDSDEDSDVGDDDDSDDDIDIGRGSLQCGQERPDDPSERCRIRANQVPRLTWKSVRRKNSFGWVEEPDHALTMLGLS